MATNNLLNQYSTGIQSLTSGGVFNGRTITGTSNQISVSNGDGTAGNPTLSLTSSIYVSGISFNSGSNSLSIYTTGTYTPTITGSSSNPSIGYTTQLGRYTKIGDRVTCLSIVIISSKSGGSGNAQVSAFPFTLKNVSGNATMTIGFIVSGVTFSGYLNGQITANNTNMIFQQNSSGASNASIQVSALAATTQVKTVIIYEV